MKHLFIINPVAGGKKNISGQIEQTIRTHMSGLGLTYEIYYTNAPMNARDKVHQEAEFGLELRIYACGGDGTLNECINGAAGYDNAAVTHYPCGTGNDFIKMFGKDDAEKFKDLNALINGFTRPLDLIDCNGRYGLSICSVGVDARIGTDVHKYSALPLIGGATGYIVSMAVNFFRGINEKYNITCENKVFSGSFALMCACNGRYYGGGFHPVPDAMPDDGFLDFLIVRGVSRLKFLKVVSKYAKGRYKELSDIISYIRGKNMKIQSQNEQAVNIDGELIRAKDITFSLVPDGVRFLFPSNLRFFALREQPSEASVSIAEI